MRRFWIGMVSALAFVGLVSTSGTADARTGRVAKTSACSDLVKGYQKVNALGAEVDFNHPKTLNKALKQAAQQLRSLATSAPSALRASFKRLAAAYKKLATLNYSKPDSFTKFTATATTYAPDFARISAYLSTTCGFTVPTGESSIPTT